jgi:hypothetical protein
MKWLLLGVGVGVLGCGTPLADDSVGGEPLVTLEGEATGVASAPLTGELFWMPRGASPYTSFGELKPQASTHKALEVPRSFTWAIFDPPPDEALITLPGGARYALGMALMFEDRDGDSTWSEGEPIVGDAHFSRLLYTPEDLTAAQSPTHFPIPSGYHVVGAQFGCPGPPQPVRDPTDCGNPLGDPCESDTECGPGGTCMLTGPPPWPHGACVVSDPPASGCRPSTGRLVHLGASEGGLYWAQSCERDSDCTRGAPYQCDYSVGACLPTQTLLVTAGQAKTSPLPACAPPPPPI